MVESQGGRAVNYILRCFWIVQHHHSLELKHTHTHTRIHILTHYKQGPSIKLACVSNPENKEDGIE